MPASTSLPGASEANVGGPREPALGRPCGPTRRRVMTGRRLRLVEHQRAQLDAFPRQHVGGRGRVLERGVRREAGAAVGAEL